MDGYGMSESGSLTIAEYSQMPRGEEIRHELVRGSLVRQPRPGARHGAQAVLVAAALHDFVRGQRLGQVFVETAYILGDEPPTVRAPDVSFVSAERLGGRLPRGFLRGGPDLSVEILSPSNTGALIRARIADCLASGTRLAWVVDSVSETVTVHAPGSAARVVHNSETLTGGEVLPGFRLEVAELFYY